MQPVFGHGQLRLYLLAVLRDGPRHGYDIIRDLEERFSGLYSPSAGTVYPRLAKLEEEGLVAREDEGRKALYRLTDAGRAEVAARADELVDLDASLDASATRLAQEMRNRVRSGAADLRTQLQAAAMRAREAATPIVGQVHEPGEGGGSARGGANPFADVESLVGELLAGRLPDTETLTRTIRETVARGPGAWSQFAGGPSTWAAHTDPAPGRPQPAPSDPAWDIPHIGLDPQEQPIADAGPVPDATEEPTVRPVDAHTAEPAASCGGRRGPHDPGFPTAAQVREVLGILKDARDRIVDVLSRDPRAGDTR